jgi:hypothetical protein
LNNNDARTKRNIVYQIIIQGHLEKKWETWLDGKTIQTNNQYTSQPETTIITNVPDQAALRGILTKLWDLNLTVISVSILE